MNIFDTLKAAKQVLIPDAYEAVAEVIRMTNIYGEGKLPPMVKKRINDILEEYDYSFQDIIDYHNQTNITESKMKNKKPVLGENYNPQGFIGMKEVASVKTPKGVAKIMKCADQSLMYLLNNVFVSKEDYNQAVLLNKDIVDKRDETQSMSEAIVTNIDTLQKKPAEILKAAEKNDIKIVAENNNKNKSKIMNNKNKQIKALTEAIELITGKKILFTENKKMLKEALFLVSEYIQFEPKDSGKGYWANLYKTNPKEFDELDNLIGEFLTAGDSGKNIASDGDMSSNFSWEPGEFPDEFAIEASNWERIKRFNNFNEEFELLKKHFRITNSRTQQSLNESAGAVEEDYNEYNEYNETEEGLVEMIQLAFEREQVGLDLFSSKYIPVAEAIELIRLEAVGEGHSFVDFCHALKEVANKIELVNETMAANIKRWLNKHPEFDDKSKRLELGDIKPISDKWYQQYKGKNPKNATEESDEDEIFGEAVHHLMEDMDESAKSRRQILLDMVNGFKEELEAHTDEQFDEDTLQSWCKDAAAEIQSICSDYQSDNEEGLEENVDSTLVAENRKSGKKVIREAKEEAEVKEEKPAKEAKQGKLETSINIDSPVLGNIMPTSVIKKIDEYVSSTLAEIDRSTSELRAIKKSLTNSATASENSFGEKTERISFLLKQLSRIELYCANTIKANKFDKGLLDLIFDQKELQNEVK